MLGLVLDYIYDVDTQILDQIPDLDIPTISQSPISGLSAG